MGHIGAIAVLILTPVLWILSHKYFRFIYFGNIGNAILKEILECFFLSILLVSVFGGVLKTILSGIGTILLFLLKAALIIAGIVVVILLISAAVNALSAKKGDGKASQDSPPQDAAKQADAESSEAEQPCEVASAEAAPAEIAAYMKENFSSSDHLQAIKYYREKTGADLETAKAAVHDIFQSEAVDGELQDEKL